MNLKDEVIDQLEGLEVLCAEIFYDEKSISLKVGGDVGEFLDKLDFQYDSGFGCQYVDGTIWLKDGTWIERYEYDGSEWWRHVTCPAIKKELL